MNAVSLPIQLVFMHCLMQVQWSSLRPTQLPLICVELATSPSGVSMVGWRMCWLCTLDFKKENSFHGPAFLYCVNTLWYSFASQLLKWLSSPWPWQAGQPPLWVSPGQPATPSATPSLCPTQPKMAPSLSPNLPKVTPPTLWPPSNPAPLIGLRWRLWGREMEQTNRGQSSLGTLLLKKVRSKHVHLFSWYVHMVSGVVSV